MDKQDQGAGTDTGAPQGNLPDPKFDVGLGFTPPSSFNLADDYIDMDEAFQNYIMSLNDLPPATPGPQPNAQAANTAGIAPDSQSNDPNALGVPNLGSGQQYMNGVGLPAVPGSIGAHQQLQHGGRSGEGFVFGAQAEGTRLEKTSSGSEGGSGKGERTSRGKKRREVDEPDLNLESFSVEKKQQVMQEKNRLAQRRFRERQKAKVHDLHKQIEELRERVDSLQVDNTSLQSQNSILEKVLAMRDEQIGVLQEHTKILDVSSKADVEAGIEAEKACQTTLTLSALRGKVVRLSCEMLKNMSTEELMQIWQNYVTEISSALVEANSNAPEAMERIEKLISEVSMLCLRFAVLNPIACKMWATRQYHLCEADELKRWQAVTCTLDMTKDQKVEMTILRRMLLQKLQQLVEERRKLNVTVQTTLPSSAVGHRIALEYLKANQAVVRLKDILRSEHNAMLDFVSTIIKKVLKPIQVARLMVQAYPSKPDMLAVASAVAIESGEDVRVLPEPGKGVPMLPPTVPKGEMIEGALALMGCGLSSMGDGEGASEASGKRDSFIGELDSQMNSAI